MNASLHRLQVSCSAFLGLDVDGLLQLFKDNLKDIYEKIIFLDSAEEYLIYEVRFTVRVLIEIFGHVSIHLIFKLPHHDMYRCAPPHHDMYRCVPPAS